MQTPAVLHMAGVQLNAMQREEMLSNKMTPAVLLMAAISSITHTPKTLNKRAAAKDSHYSNRGSLKSIIALVGNMLYCLNSGALILI